MTPQTWEGWILMYNYVIAMSQYYQNAGSSLAYKNNPDDMNVQEMYLRSEELIKLGFWIKKRIQKYYA